VTEDQRYSFIFNESGDAWRIDSLSSNANFVCHRHGLETAEEQLTLCCGSYAMSTTGIEVQCRRRVSWAEAVVSHRGRMVFASDQSALSNQPTLPQAPLVSAVRGEV
jgi:hypothetical protein